MFFLKNYLEEVFWRRQHRLYGHHPPHGVAQQVQGDGGEAALEALEKERKRCSKLIKLRENNVRM